MYTSTGRPVYHYRTIDAAVESLHNKCFSGVCPLVQVCLLTACDMVNDLADTIQCNVPGPLLPTVLGL